MSELKRNERLLKHCLKKRKTITLALIITFLITGNPFVTEEINARDLRGRERENNYIIPDRNGPNMSHSANNTDVINIINPNSNGISHNKFKEFNVGAGNSVIFNNNATTKDVVSSTGGLVQKNTNLTKEATTILSEVNGVHSSNINGTIEIAGKKADFILANENGINLNGASFINTNGITLTTGKVFEKDNSIQFDVKKGNIFLNGVGTSGDYFNVLAQTIELHNEISPLAGEKRPDMTLVSGRNVLKSIFGNLDKVEVLSTSESELDKYGIYADKLGAMYGKNIRLISTGKGLGVKHEGSIFSEKDIIIDAQGDIYANNIVSDGKLNIKGKNFVTTEDVVDSNKKFENMISAKGDINLKVQNGVEINSVLQSYDGNIDINAKDIINRGIITTNHNLKLLGKNILNEKEAVIKGADLDLEAESSFINRGDIRENKKELNEFIDPKGKLKIKVTSGILENYGNISAKKIELLTQNLINSLTGKISAIDGDIVITTFVGDLINNGEIFTKGDISIVSNKNIINKGKLSADNLIVQALQGNFLNAGNMSAINELSIIVDSLINAGSSDELERYLGEFYAYSESELKKVEEIIANLEKNGGTENKKDVLNYFLNIKKSLSDLKAELSKTGTLGTMVSKNISINGKTNIKNSGIINSVNKIEITGNTIENTGVLQSEGTVLLKAIDKILNSGRLTAKNDITIDANSFISTGDGELLSKYLELLKDFDAKELENLKSEIAQLEKKLAESSDKNTKSELEKLREKLGELREKQSKITSFAKLGVIESGNIVITTKESLSNNGIIISQGDISLDSKGDINNSGTTSVGKNLLVKAQNFISKNLSAGEKIIVDVKERFSSENLTANNSIEIKGNFLNKGDLNTNKGIDISGDLKTEKGSKLSAKEDISIQGGADLNGDLVSNGNFEVDDFQKDFFNRGNLEVSGNVNIKTKNIENNNATIGGDLILTGKDSISNTGKLQIKNNTLIKGNTFNNSGEIISGNNFSANLEDYFKSKELTVKGDLNIQSEYNIDNTNNITVGKNSTLKSLFGDITTGTLHTQGKTTLDGRNTNVNKEIVSSGVEIKGNLNSNGTVSSKGDISVSSKDKININNKGKMVATGDIILEANGDITNNGMLVSNKDIKAKGNYIKNNNATIWASNDIELEAFKNIQNTLGTIEAKGNMTLTGQEVINEAGIIKAGKNLDINADSVVNKSYVVEDIQIKGYTTSQTVTKWDDTFNYHLDYVKVKVPQIVDNSYVKTKATISSGGDLTIKGKNENTSTNVVNESGMIASTKNIDIIGNVKNTTLKKDISLDWILEHTEIELYWETKLYITHAHGNSGLKFRGSLKDALEKGFLRNSGDKFYTSLTQTKDPLLNQVLSTLLGADWKNQPKAKPKNQWNKEGKFTFVAANAGGQIFAGQNIHHRGGEFINDGGESGENKDITIKVGEENVNGIVSNGSINIGDINDIKEVDGVKQLHNVEIQKGEVTLNGVTIKAESGNIAGSIAVAGTINPIIFVDIPTGENGIFKPATPKPNGIQPMFETNIEFIDPDKFYGSDYFFEQIGYDKNKTSSVIGDAYYEYTLVSKMIQQGLGYSGSISAEYLKSLLDNALKIQEELNLEVGKPLTAEQVNKLEKNIIWYVEVEVKGQKTLVPQIYFSNKTRVDIAQGQGSGGNSIVKAGGSIITDNTNFVNTNGSITANGNIIIKSQNDIVNNSSGAISGGITSNTGNIALDANGDVNIIGGNIKGDNVLVNGNNVNIKSTLTNDTNGNQKILDKGSIEGNNGIQIDAKKDVNVIGGNLIANGTEVKPEKKEEFSEIDEPSLEKIEIEKDVKYYEELFKKESKDIIEGDAGSININAKGDVNIKDMHTTSSKSESQLDSNGNYSEKSSTEVKSNGSNILGSNVNIKSDKNVNIQGSNIGTNDLFEENKDENLKSGSINIDAKKDVNIEASKDIYQEKSSYKKTSMEKGLLTTKWGDKQVDASVSKGSLLQTGGNLNISSGNNVKVQGSDIISGGNTSIDAKNNVDILDGRDKIQEKSSDNRYQVLGGGNSTIEKKASNSKGSNIITGGDFTVDAKNTIKIVNGQINSNGNTKLKAGTDILIEAGKNEYTEKSTSTNVGIYVEGSVGVGGVGVTGNASTSDMSAKGEINKVWGGDSQVGENLDGSNEKTPTTSGKPHMDQLVNSELGFKVEHKKQEIDETTWSESQLQGDNITIDSGNKVDIGGADYKAKNNINITGKSVESKKYEDKRVEKNEGFTIAVKQSQGVSSSVADTINTGIKMDQAIKSGNGNTGVLVAQGVGSASNLIFNDLIGSFSKQSANVSIENSKKIDTSENISSLEGKNINIKSTEGDITLNGVEIKGDENVSLDSKKNINISSAKKTSSEVGFKVDLEAQLEESAGYSALWGGNTDIGVGGSVNIDVTKNNSTEYINSQIKSDGNLSLKSGNDTNIKGGELEGKKDVTVDVGGNLNIESQKSSYDENSINANAGGNVSIGGSTNTIGKAELGLSGGGGNLYKKGETVAQSGIKSGGNLNVTVGKDVNIIGGVLGSETGEGNLKVGGNLNVKDITTTEKQDGSHITVSGGFSGDMGVDGTIGDKLDKQVTSKGTIGLNSKNIEVGGDIILNGQDSSIDNINNDLKNSQVIDKEVFEQGGDISFSGSTSNIKDVKDKINQVKNKFNESKKNLSNKGNMIENENNEFSNNLFNKDIKNNEFKSKESNQEVVVKNINILSENLKKIETSEFNSDVTLNSKKSEDKYNVLDKENAFDFPKDDGIRVDITDKAHEDKIVPEHYEPLNTLPHKKSTRREGNNISGPLPGSAIVDGVRQNKSKLSDTISKKGTIRDNAEISSPVKNKEIYSVEKPLVIGSDLDSNFFEGISPSNFLGNINTKENNEKLADLSEEFYKNGITDRMKKFFEKKDNSGITSNINKYILSNILGTQEGAEGLSKIYQSNIQLKQDPNNTIIHEKLKEGLKQFDTAKNKAVTDIMLNSGLSVYVSVTDAIKEKNGKFDVNNLYYVFDKNNPEFNSQKNNELRDLIQKHLDKDNLKLTVNGQVISLPLSLKEKLKNQKVFESNKKYEKVDSSDKYNALDKDNVLDFPKDDGVRVDITDRANESVIVPEYYHPLGQPKPKKELSSKEKELEKKYSEKIDEILIKQKELVEKDEKYLGEPENLEKKLKKVLEEIENDVKSNGNIIISPSLKEKLEKKLKEYADTKDKYFSGKEQVSKNINEDLKVITRSEKDIRANIASVSKEIDKLPKEHVLKYLENTFTNSSSNIESYADYLKSEKDIVLRNPKLKNDETTERNIYNIYKSILKNESTKVREDLDRELTKRFLKDKKLKELLSENKLNEKNIKELFDIVQKNKKEVYEERLNESYKELPLLILPPNENPNILGENNGREVKVYLNKEANLTEVFETLVHEMTHQDQNTIIESMNPEVNIHSNIYYLNSVQGGYLGEGGRFYRDQPVEREAFESTEKIMAEVLKTLENNSVSYSESSDSDSDDELDFASFVKASFNKSVSSNNESDVSKYSIKNPLPEYRNPPSYEESTKGLVENSKKLQIERDTIQKDIDRVNKIKEITGGDLGIESTLDMLGREKTKREQELSVLDKKTLAEIPKENQDKFKNLSEKLDNLLKKQEEISNKGLLTDGDRNSLDNIENSVKEVLKSLTQLKSQEKIENNLQDITLKKNDKNEEEKDFDDNDSIWENRLEEKIGDLLVKQKELSEKKVLSKKDKKALEDIEKKLKDTIEEIKSTLEKNSEIYKKDKKKDSKNPKPKIEQKIVFSSGDKLIKRSESDIRKNLKEISKHSDKIPQEHLLNYLENVIENKEFNEIIKTVEEGEGNIVVANPFLNNDISTEKALDKIYKDIYNREDTSFRNEMDTKLYDKIIENKEILSLLKKDKLSKEELNIMIKEIKKLKDEVFKETFSKELNKIKFEVHNYDPIYEGGYKNGKITLHWNPNEKPLDTLKTLIHEITHAEQNQLSQFKDENLKNLSKLYKINAKNGGYLLKNEESYKNQPLEKEAHKAENDIGEKLQNKLKENNLNNSNDLNILEKTLDIFKKKDSSKEEIKTSIKASGEGDVTLDVKVNNNINSNENRLSKEDIAKIESKKEMLAEILNKQKEIISADSVETLGIVKELEEKYKKIKEELNEIAKDKIDKNIELSREEEELLKDLKSIIKKYEFNKNMYFNDFFPKPAPQDVIYKDSTKIIIRDEQDIRDNLKKIADSIDNIPEEHLLNYLEKVINNEEYHTIINSDLDISNKTLIGHPKLDNDLDTEKNLNKIFEKVYDSTDKNIIKDLNSKLGDKLSSNSELKNILKENKVNEDVLVKIAQIVQQQRKETFEEKYKIPYKDLPVVVEPSNLNEVDSLGINTGDEIVIYYDKDNIWNKEQTLKEYLSTIVHETAHQDQRNMIDSDLNEFGKLKNLLEVNGAIGGYLKKDEDEYRKQPLEKEAFDAEEIVPNIIENLLKGNSEKNNKYDILDKDNAFDLPQDDRRRVDITDRVNESEIVPKHYEPLQGIPEKFEVQNKSKDLYTVNTKESGYLKNTADTSLYQPVEKDAIKVQKSIIKNLKNSMKSENDEVELHEDAKKKFKNKKKVKPQKEVITELSNGNKLIVRGEKDIKNKLKLVAKEADSIPAEHLSNFLGDILTNSSNTHSKNNNINQTIIKNPEINHDEKSAGNLTKIYTSIYNRDKSEVREQLNNKFLENIRNNSEINNILKENNITPENLKKLADLVGNEKEKVFKEVTGKEYSKANVVIKGPHPTENGNLMGNTLTIHTNKNRDIVDVFGTIVHEYTHNDQRNLQEFEHNLDGSQLPYLYNINKTKSGYITPASSIEGYKNQPLEKEAYDIQKKFLKEYREENSNEHEIVYSNNFNKNDGKKEKIKYENVEAIDTNTGKVIVRNEKDIRKNLKLVSEMADKIPKEHLTDYLKNVIVNKSFADTVKKTKNDETIENKVWIKVPLLDNNKTTEKTLGKIYDKLYSKENKEIREKLDKDFIERLEKNQKIDNLLKKDSLTKEEVLEMAKELFYIKKSVYEKNIDQKYRDIEVEVNDYDPKLKGSYSRKTGILSLYYRPTESPLATLKTIAHELTHVDQHTMIDLTTDDEKINGLADIYYVNTTIGGYLEKDYSSYRNQPMEKEAHDIEDVIKRKYSMKGKKESVKGNSIRKNTEALLIDKVDSLTSKGIITNISKDDIKKLNSNEQKKALKLLENYEKLSSNLNENTLSEFTKLLANMEQFSDEMEEKYSESESSKILIEHFPNISTGNLEDQFLPPYPGFDKNTLIYGASGENHDGTPRDELVEIINSKRDIPLIADIFLYDFDVKDKDDGTNSPLREKAKEFINEVIENKGEISEEVIEKFISVEDYSYVDISYFHADKVNKESQKEIIKELLENREFSSLLKEVYNLNFKLKELNLKLKDQTLSEYNRTYIERQIDNIIDEIYEIFPKMNSIKTIKILDKVLENGGKIYFALDGVATSKDEFGRIILDRKKLSDILYNRNSKYYNTVTSQEIRHIYKNHLNKSGLKFMIDSHIITTPMLSE